MKKTIRHEGQVYYWLCTWGDGDYYENAGGFIMTNGKGEVHFASLIPLEQPRRIM